MIGKKKIGRPVSKDGQKTKRLVIRLSEEDYNNLEFMSYFQDKTKTEIVRDALKKEYLLMKYSN